MQKNVSKTFRFTRHTVDALHELVLAGRAESQTALLEALVAAEKARLDLAREEREMEAAWRVALLDPEYRAEILAVETAFLEADAESARQIR